MNTIALDDVLRRTHNLPSLPTVVLELLASMDQEDVNIDTLTSKIGQDQALTAKTLRLANSSFYGMAKQVSTIHEAIAIFGILTRAQPGRHRRPDRHICRAHSHQF